MKTILIVDDEVNIVKANARMFKASGWNTLTALTVEEALALIPQADVILSDYDIDVIDGGDIVFKAAGSIPVVIFTGRQHALPYPNIVRKPAMFDTILDAVSKCVL